MVKRIEYEPRTGTIRHTVWEGIGQDKSLRQIRQENNYNPKQIYAAATKVIDPSDRYIIRQEWIKHKPEVNRAAKESIYPDIAPFVGMWMVTLEIQRAMIETYGVTYGYRPIQDASILARQTGYSGTRRFSKEEIVTLRREALHQHKDEIPARVRQWLDTAAVILSHPSHAVPGSREEWKQRIERYKKEGLVGEESIGAKWQLIVRLYYENNRALPANWSREGLEGERIFVENLLNPRRQRLNNREIVLRELDRGKTHPEIVEATGLTRRQVTYALSDIYKDDKRERPSPEQQKASWKAGHPGTSHTRESRAAIGRGNKGIVRTREQRLATSAGKSGGAVYVEDLMYLGFETRRELDEAVFLYKRTRLVDRQVFNALNRARARGDIPLLVGEAKERAYADRTVAKEVIRERVRQQFESLEAETAEILAQRGLIMPEDFSQRAMVMHYVHAIRTDTISFFIKRLNSLSLETRQTVQPYIEALLQSRFISFIEQENIRPANLKELVGRVKEKLNGLQMPDDPELQGVLGLWLYAREESAQGSPERGLEVRGRFLSVLDSFSPEQQASIREHMDAILKAVSAHPKGNIQKPQSVYGEMTYGEMGLDPDMDEGD